MDITGDDEASYGRDSRSGSGGSSSSDLEDIENELYSRIYYRSSEAIGSTSAIDADASAQAAVDGATAAAVFVWPESSDQKANGDILVSDDASEDVKEDVAPRSCTATEAGREAAAAGRPGQLGRQAAATVDLTQELDEYSQQIELGDLSPDEYVVLSSVDEDDVVVTSRVRPSRKSVAVPQPLDSSKVTIESDDSDDHYEIDDSCDFEFNHLAQTPRSTTTFFGTLRDVLSSLPPHSWRISDADRYPDTFRGRYYNTRCKRCNEKGHAVRDCRKLVKPPSCIQCGMRGHVQWSCKRQLCKNCGQFGHVLSTCTLKHRKLLYCQRCHRRGHLDEVCSELWRQFHWVSKPEAYKSVSCKPPRPVGVNKVRYCANCGLRGHFLHDCKALQLNPFRPAPSVFVNVYRNDSARRGGTPNVKASRKAVMRDNIVSASAVRPSRRRSFTETGLAGADDDICASPVSKKRGDGRLRTPTAAVPANESHLSFSGRKQKRRLRVESSDSRRRTSSVASTIDVNATEGRSPGTTSVNLATGGSPNGDATARARNAAVAAAELEAASSTAVPPWEQHESSPGKQRLSSPLKRPWLYDRSPAGVQPRGASADSNDVELLPAKRRHLVDGHSTGLDRRSFSASKTTGKKKSHLAAKSRSTSELESGRGAELQSGGKKHGNPGKSPGGKQPGQAAKRKSFGQQPRQQRQHQQPQQQRPNQQPRQQQPLQQQQRPQQQRQHHRQQQQREHHHQLQQQQHRQQQLRQPQHHQRQRQNHQQQHPQQRQRKQQHLPQHHTGSTLASGHHSSTVPLEHYPSQRQQRKYWPTAEARGGGGRVQATSQSYQVVKHGDFTGHYYRSGSEMVVKFDY